MTLHRVPAAPLGSIAFERDPVCWMAKCEAFTRPQQQRSREGLQRIVVSAVTLFSENGFDSTRVADIASHANVPIGKVYQHFADKEALLDAIVAGYRYIRMREIRELCDAPEARTASPRELIELHIDIVFSVFCVDAGLLRLIERRRLEHTGVHRDQSTANEIVAGLIAERLIEKLPDRDPVELRRQVLYVHSIIRGAVVWSVLPRDGEIAEGLKVTDTAFAQEALTMSLRYLRIEEQEQA